VPETNKHPVRQFAVRVYAFILMIFVLAVGCLACDVFFKTMLSFFPEHQPVIFPSIDKNNCLACHGPTSTENAKRPYTYPHPSDGFKEAGLTPIACITCHIAHNIPFTPPPKFHPNVARTTCTKCHGDDAEEMFTHFHQKPAP